jgi:hypothetical protein
MVNKFLFGANQAGVIIKILSFSKLSLVKSLFFDRSHKKKWIIGDINFPTTGKYTCLTPLKLTIA